MSRNEVVLLAILLLFLGPLIWMRAKMDKMYGDAARRRFSSWTHTWRRLGGSKKKL